MYGVTFLFPVQYYNYNYYNNIYNNINNNGEVFGICLSLSSLVDVPKTLIRL